MEPQCSTADVQLGIQDNGTRERTDPLKSTEGGKKQSAE